MTSGLTESVMKRQVFVREMAKHGNRIDAVRKAGYSRPTTDGTRLLKLTAVRDAIEAEQKRHESKHDQRQAYD